MPTSNAQDKPLPLVPHSPPAQSLSVSVVSMARKARARKAAPMRNTHDQSAEAQYIDTVLRLAKLELNEHVPQATDARDRVFDKAIDFNSRRLVSLSCPGELNTRSSREPDVISIPSSASSASSSSRSKGGSTLSAPPSSTVRCSGHTLDGHRCKRTIKIHSGMANRYKDVEHFCHQHRPRLLEPTGFYLNNESVWIVFSGAFRLNGVMKNAADVSLAHGDWIPKYLHKDTQAALRVEMEKPISASDGPGYIYAFEIRDPRTEKLRIKVGRAVNVVKRIYQWEKQCKTHEHVLRGFYPDFEENNASKKPSSRLKGLIQLGPPAAWCHRLERLIHLELADLTSRRSYLDPAWPDVTTSAASPQIDGTKSASSSCIDCGQAHMEIFDFARPKHSKLKNKEWETLVLPVIQKWGRFISQISDS
ncbi:hypothetical protein ONZ45_g16290 [Pleurotus djamor]|nr:hypothetical protein ONZ45_g16290 [Pleurotus djamor]